MSSLESFWLYSIITVKSKIKFLLLEYLIMLYFYDIITSNRVLSVFFFNFFDFFNQNIYWRLYSVIEIISSVFKLNTYFSICNLFYYRFSSRGSSIKGRRPKKTKGSIIDELKITTHTNLQFGSSSSGQNVSNKTPEIPPVIIIPK